jgi:hypothetical protein
MSVTGLNSINLTAVLREESGVAPNAMRVLSPYRYTNMLLLIFPRRVQEKKCRYPEYDLSHQEEATNISFGKLSLVISGLITATAMIAIVLFVVHSQTDL